MFSKFLCALLLAAAPLPVFAQSSLVVNGASLSGACTSVVPVSAAASRSRVVIAIDAFRAIGFSTSPLGTLASCDIFLDVSTQPGYSAGLLNVRYQGAFVHPDNSFGPVGNATFSRLVGVNSSAGFTTGTIRTTAYSSATLIENSDLGAEFANAGPASGSQSIELHLGLDALGDGSVIQISAVELEFAVFNSLGQLVTE